jgi:signal transduction histidine kinase
MPLANNIIRLHKGNLSVDSDISKGTKVTIRFPLEPTAMEPAGQDAFVH